VLSSAGQIPSSTPHANQLDIFITRASGLASVGTLVFAIFGYFYTVLPVFQNQKLQEDNAKLQLDNEAAAATNKVLLKKQADLAEQTAHMQAELKRQNSALTAAARNTADAKAHELSAIRLASGATAQMKAQYSELDKARWKLAMTHLWTALIPVSINANQAFTAAVYADDVNSSFITSVKDHWPDPLQIVSTTWTIASKDTSSVPSVYFQRIREYIDAHPDRLRCAMPDLVSMAKRYDAERQEIMNGLEKKANDEIERQRTAAKAEGKRLLVTPQDVSRLKASFEVGDIYSLQKKYRDPLLNDERTCNHVVFDFLSALSKEFNVEGE